MPATYFDSPDAFRAWLDRYHDAKSELLLGFYKTSAKKKGITYPQALDEALAFGWIDGVRRGVDVERYTIRFTPRKPTSIWSAVNIKRVGELTAARRMRASGLAAFARRTTAHWLTSAKRAETRERRLAHLIDCSRKGKRIDLLAPSTASPSGSPPASVRARTPSAARRPKGS